MILLQTSKHLCLETKRLVKILDAAQKKKELNVQFTLQSVPMETGRPGVDATQPEVVTAWKPPVVNGVLLSGITINLVSLTMSLYNQSSQIK